MKVSNKLIVRSTISITEQPDGTLTASICNAKKGKTLNLNEEVYLQNDYRTKIKELPDGTFEICISKEYEEQLRERRRFFSGSSVEIHYSNNSLEEVKVDVYSKYHEKEYDKKSLKYPNVSLFLNIDNDFIELKRKKDFIFSTEGIDATSRIFDKNGLRNTL